MPTPRHAPQATLGKLRTPRLGRVFARDGLHAQIDDAAGSPGLWVKGPPGMGKTTLVATYLEARQFNGLWLQLDAGDADPATFVHFLGAAAALHLPRRKPILAPPSADDLRDVPAFIRRCFRQLALVLAPPWALVLDNAQELGSAPALHAGLAAALAELPEHARLIAISREPPPAEYARALANQQLAVIDETALRFSKADTERLLALHGRDWPAETLRGATDGWAAAMVLLLATRSDLGPEAALQSHAGRGRLFDFFAGEVMDKMAPSDAAALMRIAFLPHATAATAVAISGDARAGDLVAELARRSLFTDRRDATPPTYTLHALFGDFLRSRAAQTLSAEALRALQLDAAAILAEQGLADAAIAQLLQAQAWDAALQLIVAHAGHFAAQGRTQAVRDWLLALPPYWRGGAQACYWLGYCALAVNPAAALQDLERAFRGFEAVGDAAGGFFTAAAAADAIVFLGANLHAIEAWMPVLESHAGHYLAQRDAESDLRVLPGLLAAFVHRETAHPLTAQLAELAERMLDQPLGAGQRILLGTLAYYLLWTGQTERLDRIVIKLDRLCVRSDAAPATQLRWYGVGVLVRSLLGRGAEALALAHRALALASPGPAAMRAKAHLLIVLAAIAVRDGALARVHLTEAAATMDPANAIDATTYEFQRGMLMLLEGDWASAASLMRAAVASGQASGWPLREHIALLGQVATATQVGEFDEAEAALQAVLTHRFHAVCRWHHWLAALLESHLAERRGEQARCLAALARAFAIGREYGFDFGPLPYCCGAMMPRLAWLAIEHGIDPAFAVQIIRRHGLPAPPEVGAAWPWPIRIRTLGLFALEREGETAAAPRKESRKPLDLLKLLIALGSQAVPVARLCAALWPEAEGDAARNSFDNALHRLRKLLGGDQHLSLRAGGLSLDTRTCWADLPALEAGLTEADRLAPEADADKVSATAERVLALYRGEFLAGDEDLPDVLVARARIQARFTRQMAVLGARLEALGAHAQAVRIYERVIESQPLAEDIYRRLIGCLLALGQRAEAYEAFRRCRQQLSVVLGLRPAPETEALVASLRDL